MQKNSIRKSKSDWMNQSSIHFTERTISLLVSSTYFGILHSYNISHNVMSNLLDELKFNYLLKYWLHFHL